MSGCGEAKQTTYPVSGKLLLPDGTPLKDMRISFRSVDATPIHEARGTTNANGAFQLTTFEPNDGAIAGKHIVVVMAPTPRDTDGMTSAERQLAMEPIDRRYRDYGTSGLEFTVSEGETNDFEIVVSRPRR